MTLEQVRDLVRSAAHSIPPSDAGSTRAINAIAGAVWERLNKLTWQVRDTCARAEKAEAALRWIESNYANQDLSHKDFRVEAFSRASPAFNAIPKE